jgi:5-methylcytosine-specific restriction endonuclease McrA
MEKVLCLNVTYEPLRFIPIKRALLLLFKKKAEVVSESDLAWHSERQTILIPSVVRLLKFVRLPNKKVKLTKRALMVRDGGLCGYCGEKTPKMNIDHIVPRSRGGKHTWTNVVWSCMPCNDRKADKMLSETGLTLRVKPYAPKDKMWLVLAVGKLEKLEPAWEPFLALAS